MTWISLATKCISRFAQLTIRYMRLAVRVTPRAASDRIDGFGDSGRLRVRVTAPPADDAANAAVTRLLAKSLGLAQRDITLVSGATSRDKLFDIPLDETELRRRVVGQFRHNE